MTRYEVTIAGRVYPVRCADEQGARLRAVDEYHFDTGMYPNKEPGVYDLDDECDYWASIKGETVSKG